jgi:hypothetical protein
MHDDTSMTPCKLFKSDSLPASGCDDGAAQIKLLDWPTPNLAFGFDVVVEQT